MFDVARPVIFLMLAVGLLGPVAAQARAGSETEQLRQELQALRESQAAIQRDLQEIKTLLRSRPQPPAAAPPQPAPPVERVVSIDGATVLGSRSAPVTLVEFSDFQCPFCARHERDTLPQIQRDYIDTGKVRYVLRDFPIDSLHPDSAKAHEAVRCAGDQGKAWEMRAALLSNQKDLSRTALAQRSKELGLAAADFDACLDGGKYTKSVRADVDAGAGAGVTGTPTFFVATAAADAKEVKASRVIVGAQPYATFRDAIESLLAAPAPKPAP